jgi:hypothetical protein
MSDKSKEILKYSTPHIAYSNAVKIFGRDVKIMLSSRRDKKYMLYNPNTNKWVHFGQFLPPYEDYTFHQDELRRKKYRTRNAKYKNADKYTPGYLSYHILW